MSLFHSALVLLATILPAFALLQCYEAFSTTNPEDKVPRYCPEGTHCMNLTEVKLTTRTYQFGCSAGTCSGGCKQLDGGAIWCCCFTDLCNGPSFTKVMTSTPITTYVTSSPSTIHSGSNMFITLASLALMINLIL
ncbi:unnamed protein product [Cylicocyclus nassatus]|uniref:Uncharacterized protein n=1 Tax=Cylicocyclus nassatus TaxID=53992 RepID=A0AA36HC41_CYLNA|nr:unnamed protein product [Cylicocyclus nassatus]